MTTDVCFINPLNKALSANDPIKGNSSLYVYTIMPLSFGIFPNHEDRIPCFLSYYQLPINFSYDNMVQYKPPVQNSPLLLDMVMPSEFFPSLLLFLYLLLPLIYHIFVSYSIRHQHRLLPHHWEPLNTFPSHYLSQNPNYHWPCQDFWRQPWHPLYHFCHILSLSLLEWWCSFP